MAVRRWLGDTLLNAGLVTKQQLDEALAIQGKSGEKLGNVLVDLGFISETDLLRTLSADAVTFAVPMTFSSTITAA